MFFALWENMKKPPPHTRTHKHFGKTSKKLELCTKAKADHHTADSKAEPPAGDTYGFGKKKSRFTYFFSPFLSLAVSRSPPLSRLPAPLFTGKIALGQRLPSSHAREEGRKSKRRKRRRKTLLWSSRSVRWFFVCFVREERTQPIKGTFF